MFNRSARKSVAARMAQRGFLPRLPVEHVIQQNSLQTYLWSIERQVGLPMRHFDLYYLRALYRLITMCQVLPEDETGERFVKQRLNRVMQGLSLRNRQLLPHGVVPEEINHHRDHWSYGLFTALLFHNLGAELFGYEVELCDLETGHECIWNPLLRLQQPFSFYRATQREVSLSSSTSLSLLRVIYGDDELSWLYSDSSLFQSVMTAIVDPLNEPMLGATVAQVYGISNSEDLRSIKQSDESVAKPGQDPHVGQAFLDWLVDALRNCTIAMNLPGALVFEDDDGYSLLSPEVFKLYAQVAGVEWRTVQNAFCRMRLHQKSSGMGDIVKRDVPGKKNASVIRIANKAVLKQHHTIDADQLVGSAISSVQ